MAFEGYAVMPDICESSRNTRPRSETICMMPRSNFARLRNTTRAMACDTASTEYGWRTFKNSRMTSGFPSR